MDVGAVGHVDPELIAGLGTALGLGLLVGFQRERARASLAGIRTFALISLIGAVAAHLASVLGTAWLLPGVALALAGLLVAGHAARARTESPELTTEIAAILMLVVGAMCVTGPRLAAVATGAVMALLLHFKKPLHETVERLADAEVRGVMTFVLISLVILPLLPDRAYDPLGVLNPHAIWRMVVLIVGIGLLGHAAYRLFGHAAGALLAGVIGGLISSTATIVQQARRSRADATLAIVGALVAVLASATAIVRILVEVAFVSRELLAHAIVPLTFVLGALLIGALVLVLARHGRAATPPVHPTENPAQLKTALVFAALYVVVIVTVALSQRLFGDRGLLVVAVLSGLTDVDAITLSTAQLVREARLGPDDGWRVILVAALSNLAFKGGVAFVLGGRKLGMAVGITFLVAMAVGIPLVAWWPEGWRAWDAGLGFAQ